MYFKERRLHWQKFLMVWPCFEIWTVVCKIKKNTYQNKELPNVRGVKNISSFKYFSDCLVSGKLLVLLNQTNQALEFFWFSVVNEKGDVIRLGGNVMSRWLVPLPLHRPSLPFLHLSIPLAGLSCFGFCPWPHICQPRHLSTEVTDNHSPNTHIHTLTLTQTLRYLIYIYI